MLLFLTIYGNILSISLYQKYFILNIFILKIFQQYFIKERGTIKYEFMRF